MLRIAGINISKTKQVWLALTNIYGIGKSIAYKLCQQHNISLVTKLQDLTNSQLDNLRHSIMEFIIEGDLKRQISLNIKRLIDLNCYRGLRHKRGLPVRGQRTKTNSRTARKHIYKTKNISKNKK